MRASLGVSAGTEVVCSAVALSFPDGRHTFDYRVVTADEANADLGDLVGSAIELMAAQTPREAEPARGVAVAYRDREQTHSLRAAPHARRHGIRLVPETAAALKYLHHTGETSYCTTVGICDIGARGLTVTVMDAATAGLLACRRTETVSGRAIDDMVYQLLSRHYATRSARGRRPNRRMLMTRGRAAKERLSTASMVTIDHVGGRPLELTRDDLDHLISELLDRTVSFVDEALTGAPRKPQLLALIGGGANIPSVSAALRRRLDIPVSTAPDPEAVIAKGAALIADATNQADNPPERPEHGVTGRRRRR